MSRTVQISSALFFSLILAGIWYKAPHPALIVVLAILPLGALFAIRYTFWLVTLFVIFSFFRIHEVVPALYSLKIPLLLSLGALAALGWHSTISRTLNVYWHPSMHWLAIFWLLVIIGVVAASNRGVAIDYFKNMYWKVMVMTLAIMWLVTRVEDLARMSKLIALSGLLVACVAIYNSIMGIGLVEGSRVTIGRDFGSMLGDPNDLALVLMFPFAFAISLATTQGLSRFIRVLGVVISIALLIAIIATQSRGGLLGVVAVSGVFAFRLIRSKTLIFSLGAVAAIVLYAAAGISGRASGGAAEEGVDASAMGRIYAWEAAAKMAFDNPLTGVGLDNFYYNYFYYSSHWDGLNHAVHSTWFGVMAETGILGLIVFIGLIVSLIRTAKRSLNLLDKHNQAGYLVAAAIAVYAGLIGTIVSGTFLTQGFNWPIYILAALTIAISKIAQNACQNENTLESI
ncbi:O-antigen ligase family protein [Vibrio sp. SCSIO 43136]|uniref:O-antigen ligase family protein n=1 Tax=Vibrio sp. SCSIO 43136 TaxID=2819101 RepID=UPI0020751806|nr:O-antigen ligase family protein [Vibrio sp. SCSIO 43136]USD67793.1 O-antigen ligase family protein [Vibrio sp. SCSIO 43136]